MQPDAILSSLNTEQALAVTSKDSSVLVLAGAGSGKTKVLIHRLAWLINTGDCSIFNILAVTFTNKAAQEMRERTIRLVNQSMSQLWIGTFHSICHRMLRLHHDEAGLNKNFQIIDTSDQARIIKNCIKDNNFDPEVIDPKEVLYFINACKDKGVRFQEASKLFTDKPIEFISLYQLYQDACNKNNLIDFGELILRSKELLATKPFIRSHYQNKFRHILVDEFQDTNQIQYQWLQQLIGEKTTPFIVGDDDQSIYAWRGAQSDNLLKFKKDYKNTKLIKLEQNYRSTNTILKAANAIIAKNTSRLGKSLWSNKKDGDLIQLSIAEKDYAEARSVIEKIKELTMSGLQRKDIGILYRSNAQSRLFEELLVFEKIPYKIFGGFKFFERAEVKDVLAYLRLIHNNGDDNALERIINLPVRGIGKKTFDLIKVTSNINGCSYLDSINLIVKSGKQSSRISNSLNAFADLIKNLYHAMNGQSLDNKIKLAAEQTGIIDLYKKKKEHSKIENIFELISAGKSFQIDYDDIEIDELDAFLGYATLDSGDIEDTSNCINLMTVHSAKGLEFDAVFLCGLEDGLFPHQRSLLERNGVEEERRLCYVAITRAKKMLFLSYALSRRMYGTEMQCLPSRFLHELPQELINTTSSARIIQFAHQNTTQPNISRDSGYLGKRVKHKKFGHGIVINVEGDEEHTRLQVKFDENAVKWLVLLYANLEVLD
jgi:DNA helicase-2/ATP-dependent DNA helicase PcrA